jgi:hypothetical protein
MSLRDAMIKLIREQVPMMVVPATVTRVDTAGAVCDVQPLEEGAPELLDVRLRAVDDGKATGFLCWPKLGSVVLVGLIDNDVNTAFVVACSELAAFTLSTEQENILTYMQDLLAAIMQLTVTTPAGPSGVPINLPAFQQLAQRLPNLFRQ